VQAFAITKSEHTKKRAEMVNGVYMYVCLMAIEYIDR